MNLKVTASDMVIITVPPLADEALCAEIGCICAQLQKNCGCVVELYRPTRVQYAKSNWKDDLPLLIPAPRIILDCGAHYGESVQKFREIWPRAQIISFEPVAANYDRLAEATKNDRLVMPYRMALGAESGAVEMNITRDDNCCSVFAHEPSAPHATKSEPIRKERVPVTTIDGFLHCHAFDPGEVDLVKMDIQGAELAALHGAKNLLGLRHALFFLEVLFTQLYKDVPLIDEIDEFMVECGYRRRAAYTSLEPHYWADALYEPA